jgi:cell division protein FtsB
VARHSPFHKHSHGRVFALRAVLAILLMGCAWLIFEFGRIQANYNIVDASRERQSYETHIAELDAEVAALKEVVAKLETDRAVDTESYKEVEANLVTLQAKIQEQADAIAFYRGIVSPADGAAGLKVQDLKLTSAGSERAYNVRVVLVQLLQHDRKVSGDIGLVVEGVQNGNDVSYPYAELLAAEADSDWEFSFRYFQNFDREIVLPDGFSPQRIIIAVHSKTRSIASIEQSFSWVTSRG